MSSGSSLKGYTPALAKLVGTTPAALYERQRALVRIGMLAPDDGRGPGSGVRTTASSVALVLLSVLASDRLSESDARVQAIASCRVAHGKRCEFSRGRTLSEAFARILAETGLAASLIEIAVSRTDDRAAIHYRNKNDVPCVTEFVGKKLKRAAISVVAKVDASLVAVVAKDIQEILQETFDGDGEAK